MWGVGEGYCRVRAPQAPQPGEKLLFFLQEGWLPIMKMIPPDSSESSTVLLNTWSLSHKGQECSCLMHVIKVRSSVGFMGL